MKGEVFILFFYFSRLEASSTDLPRKTHPSQGSSIVGSQQHINPSGTPSNHPLRPLSTLDSGMYTSSDDSDHDEPSNPLLEPHSPSQRMKFTTFGKSQSIREETLFEEGD